MSEIKDKQEEIKFLKELKNQHIFHGNNLYYCFLKGPQLISEMKCEKCVKCPEYIMNEGNCDPL